MTDDFRTAVFATPIVTRKYRLLTACDNVALLVDNRCKHPDIAGGQILGASTRINTKH